MAIKIEVGMIFERRSTFCIEIYKKYVKITSVDYSYGLRGRVKSSKPMVHGIRSNDIDNFPIRTTNLDPEDSYCSEGFDQRCFKLIRLPDGSIPQLV